MIEEYGSIKDFINEVYLLPYLTIGGSRNDFWELTPKDIMIDFKAHKKRQTENMQMAWVLGSYFKSALSSTILMCSLADNRTQSRMPKFPTIPKGDDEIEEEKIEKNRTDYLLAKMRNWQTINNIIQKQKKK